MIKRVRLKRKARSQSKAVSSATAPRWRLFGQSEVLEGEDGAAYDELHARIFAAEKPVDIIDEMFIADVVSSEWGVLRLRRLLLSLIRAHALEALESFLAKRLEYHLYAELVVDDLTEILQNNLPEGQALCGPAGSMVQRIVVGNIDERSAFVETRAVGATWSRLVRTS